MSYSIETLGQIAYNAYGDHVEWKAYNGEAILAWEKLEDLRRQAWITATEAAIKANELQM